MSRIVGWGRGMFDIGLHSVEGHAGLHFHRSIFRPRSCFQQICRGWLALVAPSTTVALPSSRLPLSLKPPIKELLETVRTPKRKERCRLELHGRRYLWFDGIQHFYLPQSMYIYLLNVLSMFSSAYQMVYPSLNERFSLTRQTPVDQT
jgi:hypothetical protein